MKKFGCTLVCLSLLWSVLASAQSAPSVQLASVDLQPVVTEIRLSGTVNALRSSRLSPSVAGLIEQVNVEVGQQVRAGDLLFAMDQEKAELALRSVSAQAQEAQAMRDEAKRRLDEALSVGAGHNIAATEVGARRSQLAAAEATLARLQADRELQRTIIERHQIRAPFDGVVSVRLADAGEWVEPGDELLTLVDDKELRADFQVPQTLYSQMSGLQRQTGPNGLSGEQVEVLLNPGSFLAEVDTRVPVADPLARTFLLRTVPPTESGLIPGMGVEGVLRVPAGEKALTIPRDALNRYPEGRITVWVAEAANDTGAGGERYRVEERRIQIASGFSGRVVVTDGLREGELVVSRGNESLQADSLVRIAEKAAD